MATGRSRPKRGWLQPRATPIPGDVLAALAELDIEIHRVIGEEATGRCAMHIQRTGTEDQHPSWSCNLESGAFNCFSCHWRGSFVQLVSDVLEISWDDAVAWVRERGGIERVNKILGRGQYIGDLVPEREVPVYTEADLVLFTAPPREERMRRGLTAASCVKYSIVWDAEKEMWIFPIRDAAGKLLGWQEKNERHFRNRPFSVEKGKTIFGYHLLVPGSTALLVESPPDCARIDSVGVRSATAVSSFGSFVSDTQMQMLFDICKDVIIGMDNDKAGWDSARDLKKRYSGMGRRLRFYNYGESQAKDQGEQSGEEIRFGVDNALSTMRVRFPNCS